MALRVIKAPMRFFRSLRRTRTGAMAGLLVTVSCHQHSPQPLALPPSVRAASLIALELTPSSAQLAPGARTQFQAKATQSDGALIAASVTWSATGGTISQAGVYVAGSVPGYYRIIARVQGSDLADTATVTIQSTISLLAVQISPSSAALAAGSSQMFSVVGVLADGTTMPMDAVWAATGGTIAPSGIYTAGMAPGGYRVIANAAGQADTAEVTVVAPPVTGLALRVPTVPATDDKWMLRDTDLSTAPSTCPSDNVTKFAVVELPIEEVWPGCATELSVFAKGFAPLLDRTPTPVLSGGKRVVIEALPPPWIIKLRVVAEYPEAATDLTNDLNTARILFSSNAMGVVPDLDGDVAMISPDPDPTTNKVHRYAIAIAKGCAGVVAEPGLVVPDRMNVFYTRDDQWTPSFGSNEYGYNCYLEGHPNVAFVRKKHALGTLAHELGHGLWLGHVLPGVGWTSSNVMQPSAFNPDTPVTIDRFSLGQAYRANVDRNSWINSGGIRGGPWKICQPSSVGNSSVNWPCPQLNLDRP